VNFRTRKKLVAWCCLGVLINVCVPFLAFSIVKIELPYCLGRVAFTCMKILLAAYEYLRTFDFLCDFLTAVQILTIIILALYYKECAKKKIMCFWIITEIIFIVLVCGLVP